MRNPLVIGMMTVAILATACARKPAVLQGSAPSPGGAAVSRAGSVEGRAQQPSRSTTAAGRQQPAASSQADGRGLITGATPSAGRSGPTPAMGRGAGSRPDGRSTSEPGVGQPAQPGGSERGASRPAPSEFTTVAEVADIHFDFDKYEIRSGDAAILQANAAWLRRNTGDLVLIEGHCDQRGTNEYNIALGERRAKATMDFLVAHGVAVRRITIVSYGEERPGCTAHDEVCWAKNRRAHFLVKRG